MAAFGEVDLDTGGCAVFELASKPPDDSRNVELDSGAQAVFPARLPVVVLRDVPGRSAEEVEELGARLAVQALDLLHSRSGDALSLNQDDSPRVIVWNSASGRTARIVAEARSRFRISLQLEVRDAAGNIVPATATPPLAWHPSMRYYRIAEASSDLFDSFRNTYLALESMLSDIVPPAVRAASFNRRFAQTIRGLFRVHHAAVGVPEGERVWLKRALRVVAQSVDLTPYAPPGSMKSPPNAILDDLYVNFRTATFHAKRDRPVLTPQDRSARDRLVEARIRYANLYRALAFDHLGSRYAASNLSAEGYRVALGAIAVNPEVYVSDDPTHVEDERVGEYEVAPAGGSHYTFEAAPRVDGSQPATVVITGSSPARKVREVLHKVQRLGLFRDGTHALVESLRAPLDITGLDHLEIEFVVGGRGHGTPRRDFHS